MTTVGLFPSVTVPRNTLPEYKLRVSVGNILRLSASTTLVGETNAGIGLGSSAVDVGIVVGVGESDVSIEAVSGEGASTGGKSTKSTPASVCSTGGAGSGGCGDDGGGIDDAGEGGGNADDCGGAGVGGIQPSWRATPSRSARRTSGDGAATCGLVAPSDPSGTILTNVSRLKSGGAACC